MDSKTYIRACALFVFDQGKSNKEASRVISELNPDNAMTERTCERWFANSEKATGLSRTSRAVDALKSSIVKSLNNQIKL